MDGLIERNVKLSDNSGLGNVSDIIRNREAMSYEDEARSNPMLLDLARQAEIKKLRDSDLPIVDTSLEIIPGLASFASRGIGRISNDGVQRVFHGTSPENKEKILKEGLLTSYTGKPGTLTDSALGETSAGLDSKGLAFTTGSRWDAARYAASHDPSSGVRIDSSSPISDQVNKLGRQINSYVTGKGVVEIDIPKNYRNVETINPEAKMILNSSNINISDIPEKYRKILPSNEGLGEVVNHYVAAVGFGKDKVYRADIPTKFIKGSDDYLYPSKDSTIFMSKVPEEELALLYKIREADKNISIAGKVSSHSALNNALKSLSENNDSSR